MLPPWFAQRFPADNPAAALLNLLHLAGWAVTATTVRGAVSAHPAYPAVSFAALGDILGAWTACRSASAPANWPTYGCPPSSF